MDSELFATMVRARNAPAMQSISCVSGFHHSKPQYEGNFGQEKSSDFGQSSLVAPESAHRLLPEIPSDLQTLLVSASPALSPKEQNSVFVAEQKTILQDTVNRMKVPPSPPPPPPPVESSNAPGANMSLPDVFSVLPPFMPSNAIVGNKLPFVTKSKPVTATHSVSVDARYTCCAACKSKHTKHDWGKPYLTDEKLAKFMLMVLGIPVGVGMWICENSYNLLLHPENAKDLVTVVKHAAKGGGWKMHLTYNQKNNLLQTTQAKAANFPDIPPPPPPVFAVQTLSPKPIVPDVVVPKVTSPNAQPDRPVDLQPQQLLPPSPLPLPQPQPQQEQQIIAASDGEDYDSDATYDGEEEEEEEQTTTNDPVLSPPEKRCKRDVDELADIINETQDIVDTLVSCATRIQDTCSRFNHLRQNVRF